MEIDLGLSQPALLVLDLQELFTSAEGPFENKDAGELIEYVNSFVEECEKLELPIIYSRYLFRDDLTDAGLLAENALVKEGSFCESSKWMQLDHRLFKSETRIDLHRSRPGAFWNGKLEQTLVEHNIDTLLLCGLSINNAISTTAREAFARDIQVVVVKECCGAAPFEQAREIYFDILHTWTAEVVPVEDLKQRLKKLAD